MIRLNVKLPALSAAPGNVVGRIRTRFQHEAGVLILDAVRNHLGQSSLYTLAPEYSKQKSKSKRFVRFASKAADQPIILSGDLYNALTVVPDGDGLRVEVQEGEALSEDGFDYAEKMQELTDFLGRGLADVENDLDELLATIVEQELLL